MFIKSISKINPFRIQQKGIYRLAGFKCWGLVICCMLPFNLVANDLPQDNSNASTNYVQNNIIGLHDFTLQWLDDDNSGNRGQLTIIQRDNKLIASGYQEEKRGKELNYMQLDGSVTVINKREFHITGKLVTRVDHINLEPYVREGTFIFKAWGKRPYWRMQNMRDHDVTDYVDIHFKK